MIDLHKHLLAFLIPFAVLASCSLPKDPTPDAHPNARVYTSVINTVNGGNSAEANIVDSVKSDEGVVKIKLQVTGNVVAKYIYIMYSSDNSTFVPLPIPTTKNEYGTFTGGSSGTYSLRVPNLTDFTLELPFPVRNATTAFNDVYKIWLTDDLGSFSFPAYHKTLGVATVNLMYQQAALPHTYTASSVNIGSQSSSNYGSFVSTGALISSMDSVAYHNTPLSADIRLVTLTAGKKDNNSASLWFYSPSDVTDANPAVSGQTDFVLPTIEPSKETFFSAYTGATSFDDANATTLTDLNTPLDKAIEIINGGVYVFQTQEGKKGLIKINDVTPASTITGTGSTTGWNVNASVKVLN